MMPTDKFDVYLLSELPRLKSLPVDSVFSIGLTVNGKTVDDRKKAKEQLGKLFLQDKYSRMNEAHWPTSTTITFENAFLTARVTFDFLLKLASLTMVTEVQLCEDPTIRRAPRPRGTTVNESGSAEIPKSLSKKIIAVIDNGCPFAHEALRNLSGTSNIHAIWDQDLQPDFPQASGTIPIGFNYGRQVLRAQVNKWLNANRKDGKLDEDACYKSAFYPAMRARASHGSLVLGLLTSDRALGRLKGAKRLARSKQKDTDIIFVQVPRAIPLAPSRGSVERCMLDGIRYVLLCAADGASVSIVLDYGTEMGPHNGSSWFERAVDQIVTEAKLRSIDLFPVFCSGNGFEDSRHIVLNPHATKGKTSTISYNWHVPRGTDSDSFMELWTSVDDQPIIEFRGPRGFHQTLDTATNTGSPQSSQTSQLEFQTILCKNVGKQCQVLLRVAPSRFDSELPLGAAGNWSINLHWPSDRLNKAASVHAYTHWGGHNIGFPQRVWAPRFTASSKLLANKSVVIDGLGSTWGSACGALSISAGGYEKWGMNRKAPYSSTGTIRNGTHKPNYHAVTEEFPSIDGVLSIGHRSGVVVRGKGTSFAAPQVARYLAINGQPKAITTPIVKPKRLPGFAKRASLSIPPTNCLDT
jgi:hypothetical protein